MSTKNLACGAEGDVNVKPAPTLEDVVKAQPLNMMGGKVRLRDPETKLRVREPKPTLPIPSTAPTATVNI